VEKEIKPAGSVDFLNNRVSSGNVKVVRVQKADNFPGSKSPPCVSVRPSGTETNFFCCRDDRFSSEPKPRGHQHNPRERGRREINILDEPSQEPFMLGHGYNHG